MSAPPWTIAGLEAALADGTTSPSELAEAALKRANLNRGRNTYLWRAESWTRAEAASAGAMARGNNDAQEARSPLWGLPVSVKDCFDLAGAPTSCGVRFYHDLHGVAEKDSWLVKRLRSAGAVITGKTHLHPLAYGITGENREFGDCVQPADAGALTGGSSSGAAASVQEGSAVAAIGTDTGGSIRVPAALCGLAGYRASLGRGDWTGGAHLAESFDTMGWLYRDLEDTPRLARFLAPKGVREARMMARFGVIDDGFLLDCEPQVVATLHAAARELEGLGLSSATVDCAWFAESFEIFAPIQAWEAARIHAGNFEHFEGAIRERLEWGARITGGEIAALRARHAGFVRRMNELFARHELVLMPATPVARLAAGADHSETRKRLLRYTTPFSLAGVPVLTLPCPQGGMQLAAAHDRDEALAEFGALLGRQRKAAGEVPRP